MRSAAADSRRVVDAYGDVNLRTAKNPNRYLLARAMGPELVTDAYTVKKLVRA